MRGGEWRVRSAHTTFLPTQGLGEVVAFLGREKAVPQIKPFSALLRPPAFRHVYQNLRESPASQAPLCHTWVETTGRFGPTFVLSAQCCLPPRARWPAPIVTEWGLRSSPPYILVSSSSSCVVCESYYSYCARNPSSKLNDVPSLNSCTHRG